MDHNGEWMENFSERVKAIQLEFDAFLTNKSLSDYYHVQWGADGTLLSLHFTPVHGLPREIEQALIEAFLRSKPNR